MNASAARLGASVMPLETRRDVLVSVCAQADRLGYEIFLQSETWAFDSAVLLAEMATRTRRIVLGSGIFGVWSRSAGTLAMAASTLHALSDGRFVLGLGASTAPLTEGLHDVPYVAPLARVRQTVTQVRALLRGERIPLTATAARPLRLNVPPTPDLHIYLAAHADTAVRQTGEIADGWLPFLYPRDRLAEGIGLLAEGAGRAGRADRRLAVWPTVPTVIADRSADARRGAAWFVAFYLTTMGPLYRQSLVRQGFGSAVEAVLGVNTPKFTGEVPAKADVLLDQLTVFGTPVEARQRMAGWHAAGGDVVTVFLRPNLSPQEITRTLQAFRPMLESSEPRSE